MRAHKIAQPASFCRQQQVTVYANGRQSVASRLLSFSTCTVKQRDLQEENDRLRNRLKQVEDNLTTCKKENEALTTALKAANDVDALNNTIRLLREELEFRAAEDKEVQKHIENYQLMNQKLRQQVHRLEQALRSNEAPRREEQFNTSISIVPGTPSTNTGQSICRGRSPMNLRHNEKENHVLTPKSKIVQISRESTHTINAVQLDSMFVELPRPQRHPKSRIHLAC